MIEVEVLGAGLIPDDPSPVEVRRLCLGAAERLGVRDGHVAVEFVDARRISELNGRHRGRPLPTDVLSFPIDGAQAPARASRPAGAAEAAAAEPALPPRELGDVLICTEHTTDVREAVVHGMLHLLGLDHEVDDGEMLALQRELLAR
jgi:probable rRNA maturation factor